jgi:hypothetical protein
VAAPTLKTTVLALLNATDSHCAASDVAGFVLGPIRLAITPRANGEALESTDQRFVSVAQCALTANQMSPFGFASKAIAGSMLFTRSWTANIGHIAGARRRWNKSLSAPLLRQPVAHVADHAWRSLI